MSPTNQPAWDWPPFPFILEIDTWPWLSSISAAERRSIDLATVPDEVWDDIAARGFDAVWLMGVWSRSPAGISIALDNPQLVASFTDALPDFQRDDVVGSPYCVREYTVDAHLGGNTGLAVARAALASRGVGLVLDFVPNHVAPDHPWTQHHPDYFVAGTADDLRDDPASFVEVEGQVFANGRDPYFPAWPDVVQLNAFSPSLRGAVVDTLRAIAEQCDGVRCDMAMLMMTDTFSRTWGARAGAAPSDEYWPTIIGAVRDTRADFRFIAEAYWDLEYDLQQQGFDYCYDKRLYDRLLHERAEDVRLHLCADAAYQSRLIRFIENHDEPRIASLVGGDRHRALAVATFTQCGARLVHDGEAQGRGVHLPVFIGRYPAEAVDEELAAFYRNLWSVLADPTFRSGTWRLCERTGWDGNEAYENVVAWCWQGDTRWLVVVNLSDRDAAAHVRVPWPEVRERECRLVDDLHGSSFDRAGRDLCDGLYVELDAWGAHLFRVDVSEEA